MTQNIHIPPEAVEAGARAIGEETYVGNKQTLRDAATAAIRAALTAWPGMGRVEGLMDGDDMVAPPAIFLPLPQETSAALKEDGE